MTRLFPPTDGPRVLALPPGADFGAALIAGLDARLAGQPPEAAARVEIWVNTQRTRRRLIEVLTAGPARLLPRIRTVTELAGPAEPPAGDLRRRLDLARLVAQLAEAGPEAVPPNAVFDMAGSLAALLDEMQGEGLDPAALDRLAPEEHAGHWQRNLRFLDILGRYLAAAGLDTAQGRMRAAAEARAAHWAADPPRHPVIVAGSTGSRTATRIFMAAVARLPQGAVVLPGYDAGLPGTVWARLGAGDAGAADHPQSAFRRLADAIGFDPGAVPPWHAVTPPAPERNALVSLALRPAPVTHQWRAEAEALTGSLGAALDRLDWIEAPDPRAEARAVALALRQAAETGARAALVTPDRVLARRVAAELARWRLIPDDSAGRPLALTPPGVLLKLVGELIGVVPGPAALLALLKHPLVASAPGARGPHLRQARELEMTLLRGGPPLVVPGELLAWAGDRGAESQAWAGWLEAVLATLADARAAALPELVARHRAGAEALAGGPGAAAEHWLWEKDAGAAALALVEEIAGAAAAGDVMAPDAYRALLRALMAGRDVPEEAVVTDAGVAIWGTLEARVQSADLVILGGLNEGVWPRRPQPGPWLSRTMRRDLGLPDLEARIGLSAHDFQQATGAPRVMLSRALRDAEAPSVASRWLLRLDNLLNGLGAEGERALAAARARGDALLAQAALLDRPGAAVSPAARPAPRPPVAARPAALSVTQIETLVRDPYSIYARKVLGLRRLDPPGRAADAMTRGSVLHHALEAFVAATPGDLPADARDRLLAVIRAVLAREAPWPAMRALWAARLERTADWFLDGEAERRARGRPLAREVRGARDLDGAAHRFRVTARADRIDLGNDGSYSIYDYKSGSVPSAREAAAFHLQLPLEAAIAEAGGFEGLGPAPAGRLALIGLGQREVREMDADPAAIAGTWVRLAGLIGFYQDPANGFVARLRPQKLIWESDYDHLSRKGEWSDGDRPGGWE